jgi:hypothetical protein
MTTAITTIPSDPTADPQAHTGPSTGRRLATGFALFAVGAALGWVGAAAVIDDDATVPAVVPAAVVARAETPAVAPTMSADAAARWAEVERMERLAAAECRQLSVGTANAVC